jgi:hypothetical protein
MPSKEKDQNESPSHLNDRKLDKTYKYFCILFLPIEKAASFDAHGFSYSLELFKFAIAA